MGTEGYIFCESILRRISGNLFGCFINFATCFRYFWNFCRKSLSKEDQGGHIAVGVFGKASSVSTEAVENPWAESACKLWSSELRL